MDRVLDRIRELERDGLLDPMDGDCAEIALALDHVYGYDESGFFGLYGSSESIPRHVGFVFEDGRYADGYGVRPIDDIVSEFTNYQTINTDVVDSIVRIIDYKTIESSFSIDGMLVEDLDELLIDYEDNQPIDNWTPVSRKIERDIEESDSSSTPSTSHRLSQ